jgi:UDP-3-O-[3-hydroxymyristoyl] glucosamine N-acyltransferase
MADVVIFGIQESADLADVFLTEDSPHRVVAFTVHEQYMPPVEMHRGKPIYVFEHLPNMCPPSIFKLFAHVFPKEMGKIRKSIYDEGKAMGYEFVSYIGSDSKVWTNDIGENVMICNKNIIQPFCKIGNNTAILMANHIGHHSVIGDHCYITGNTCFAGHTTMDEFCFAAPNVCANHNIHIAEGTMMALGAAITKDTEPWQVYAGNPAKARGDSLRVCRLLAR